MNEPRGVHVTNRAVTVMTDNTDINSIKILANAFG